MADTKRRLSTSSSFMWSELDSNLLESIFGRLSRRNYVRCKGVCSWWNRVAESYRGGFPRSVPLLIVDRVEGEESKPDDDSLRLFDVEEKKILEVKHVMNKELMGGDCYRVVGTSHGCLVVLCGEKTICSARVYVVNPFSRSRIQLPALKTLPQSENLKKNWWFLPFDSIAKLVDRFIDKAVLLSDPYQDSPAVLVILYATRHKLAFSKCGGRDHDINTRSWTKLDELPHHIPSWSVNPIYVDICPCNNNRVCALDSSSSVHVWDFSSSTFAKVINLKPTAEICVCWLGRYLVESSGDLFFCGFLSYTLLPSIHKMDFNQKTWIQVESVGNRVFFLGPNTSVSIDTTWVSLDNSPGCPQNNSIYFIDAEFQPFQNYLYGTLTSLDLKQRRINFICDRNYSTFKPLWLQG